MIVVPRRWALSEVEELREIPAPPGHFIIECEVAQPPSSKGRTVYVHFDSEDLTRLVKQARSAAIFARSKTLAVSDDRSSAATAIEGT